MTDKTTSKTTTSREKIKTFSRIWHRRLGVVVGIQFLFWTIGGAYFAWFHIDNVRGHTDKTDSEMALLEKGQQYVPIHRILATTQLVTIDSIELTTWNKQAVYLFKENKNSIEMYSATDGKKLSPISEETATQIAKADFAPDANVIKTQRLTEHLGEYKGALPAYRIDFDNAKATHIYVHENTGVVTARRNTIWRGFDFFWMLHILDFAERENFNNWLLKLMSLLSVLTILLGYSLWATTTPLFQKKD